MACCKDAVLQFGRLFLRQKQSKRIERLLRKKNWLQEIDSIISNGLDIDFEEQGNIIRELSDKNEAIEIFNKISQGKLCCGFGLVEWGESREIEIDKYINLYSGYCLGILFVSLNGEFGFYEGVNMNERYFLSIRA